jgi:hypothetical protein
VSEALYLDTWPAGRFRVARKAFRCMYAGPRCSRIIQPGHFYFESGDSSPEVAGGFGGERFCLAHGDVVCVYCGKSAKTGGLCSIQRGSDGKNMAHRSCTQDAADAE